MYGAIRKIRQYNLFVESQLDLFDKVVAPVLLYGCEIWGFETQALVLSISFDTCILKITQSI